MRRFARTVAGASTVVILAGVLASCSNGEEKSVPKLPARLCWDVFATSDMSPVLPPGDRAELDTNSSSFWLSKDHDNASCILYIDGNPKFEATAYLWGFEDSVDWTSWDPAKPKPLHTGDKGIIWATGAASYFTCEPAKNPNSPGEYIELRLFADDAPDKSKVQTVLPPLMKQFVAFAQRELKCPAHATS
ncbi:hypothetical protein ACIRSU_31320 [Streptomyces sp. NPDC101160]|uniref:hypothetical protein n=1 Tax=Streptomyces sp. NPDC101160 TaxID=3366118 RepID=UPI003812A3E2